MTMTICVALLMAIIALIYAVRTILRCSTSYMCTAPPKPPPKPPPTPRPLAPGTKGQVPASQAASSSAHPTDSNTGQPIDATVSPQHLFLSLDTRANPPDLDKNTSLFSGLSQAPVNPQAASATLHNSSGNALLSEAALANALRYLSAEGLAHATHVGDALTEKTHDLTMYHDQCIDQCTRGHEHEPPSSQRSSPEGQVTPAHAPHTPPMQLSEQAHENTPAEPSASDRLPDSDPSDGRSQASTSGSSDYATADATAILGTSTRWRQRAGAGVRLQGQVLARSQALLAKLRTTQYTSNLRGQRVKMYIKTRTTLGLDALPEGLAAQLQQALCNADHPGYGVLDLAVRQGCIQFTFDYLETGLLSDNTSMSCASVLQAVLPSLAPLITQHADTKAGLSTEEPLVNGQSYLLMQLGEEMAYATRSTDGTWTVAPYDAGWEAGARATGQWALGPGRQVLVTDVSGGMDADNASTGIRAAAGLFMGETRNAAAAGASAAVPPVNQLGAATAAAAAAAPAVSERRSTSVQLQVWCQHAVGHGNIQADTARPVFTGWTPVKAGEHMDSLWEGLSSGKPAAAVVPPQLQVLARCQGGYLATSVTQMQAGQNGAVLLQVELDRAPLDTLQLRHHAGGSPLGVLPLTLELWHEERWISASPVLMQLGRPAAPISNFARLLSSCSAGGLDQCWWWGSRQGAVQAALQDLLQQSDSTIWVEGLAACGRLASVDVHEPWTAADVSNMVESHQMFVQDLIAWMEAVRQLALRGNGLCYGGCSAGDRHPATVLNGPVMYDDQLTNLGAELYQHASGLGLTQIAAMVQQQQQSIVGLATAAAARAKHRSSGGGWCAAAARAWAALRVSAGGSSCKACERLYHARVSHQLAGLQVLSSMACVIMSIVANVAAIVGKRSWNNLAMAPWGLLHLAVCLERWIGGRTGKTATPSARRPPPTCSWLCVAAYLCRVSVEVCMALWILTPLDAARAQFVRGDWMVATAVFAIGEQMQASALMPSKLFMWLAAIEGLAVLSMYLCMAPRAAWAPLAPLLVVAPRLLLDMQLRALLRVQSPSPATSPANAASSGAKEKME